MSSKNTTKKKSLKPHFKLVSYTIKAVIPTGQYANIQPEVTVEAETIEHAERAVMPHIEAMFAKYRDGGVKNIEPLRMVVTPVVVSPKCTEPVPMAKMPDVQLNPISLPTNKAPIQNITAPTSAPEITLSVPFNRAKGAIDSCTSPEALKLVSDQIEKSTKLIDSEKIELKKFISDKADKIIPSNTLMVNKPA